MLRRRYEILLPLLYNEGGPVSLEDLNQTREELLAHFGGISIQPATIAGIWIHEGMRYEDSLLRITVDVEDVPENRQFFVDWKPSLLQRFRQIEIYITSFLTVDRAFAGRCQLARPASDAVNGKRAGHA